MKIFIIFWIASALIFGIPFFTDSGIIIFIIIAASILFGLKYFISHRRDLKSAIYYVRMADNTPQTPIWKTLISLVFLIGIIVLVQQYFDKYPEGFTLPSLSKLCLLPFTAGYLPQHYHKFTNSFRAYKEGIKLPGINEVIINWTNVEQILFENGTLTVKAGTNDNHYKVQAEDKSDLERIIDLWKNQTTNDRV